MIEKIAEPILIEAILDTRAQVDFLWQFFVTAHIAVFALVFIYHDAVDRLSTVARVLAVLGIGVFEVINGKALVNAYQLLDAILEQYRVHYGQVERFQATFYDRFVLVSYNDRPNMVMLTHSLSYLVIILAFTARQFVQRSSLDDSQGPVARY